MYVVFLLVWLFQEKEVEETEDSEAQPTIDFKSLKSLSDIGIDMSFLEDYGKNEHIFVFKDINSVNSDVCCQGNLYPCAYFCNVPVNLKSYCFPLKKRECLTDVQHAVILLI